MNEHAPDSNAGKKHEASDIEARSVAFYGVLLIVLVLAGGLTATIILLKQWEKGQDHAPVSPLLQVPQPVPEPRLQTHPMLDYKAFHADEEKMLHSYGWTDRPNGLVRIPVERALEIALERGLPRRPDGPAAPAAGSAQPGAKPGPGRQP